MHSCLIRDYVVVLFYFLAFLSVSRFLFRVVVTYEEVRFFPLSLSRRVISVTFSRTKGPR